MATSVKHAVQEGGRIGLEFVLRLAVVLLIGALVWLWYHPRLVKVVGPRPTVELLPGCPHNAPPVNVTQLQACLDGLQFDTVAAAGDEQRLLVHDTAGPACHFGDTTHSCRHGPLAKIEPVIGAHLRDTTELNDGRIIARLFLRPGETEPYPKLGLVPSGTTYWWIQRQSDTTAVSRYVTMLEGSVDTTSQKTITIEVHPDTTFHQALARFIWDDADETTQGPCGSGCCR